MSQEAPSIVVVGSVNRDLVTILERMPAGGETVHARDFLQSHGGKGANQAVAAARLGAKVALVAKVGGDVFGADALANFRAAGIDTSHVGELPDKPTGTATILVEPDGENRIMIVAGANGALTPADVEAAADTIAKARLVLLQLEVPMETVAAALAVSARVGTPVCLNPAPAPDSLDAGLIGPALRFVVPNRGELALLTGLPTESEADLAAAARALLARGVGAVVVTLGAEGALLVEGEGEPRRFPAARVRALDTTGAGDAFIGAFAARFVHDGDVEAAIRNGAAFAGLSVTRQGAQASYPAMALSDLGD
ncbi:ribokinase [Antarcticirhabdus aurantiaca]|uniref:Ribokinase n=1 Tax=Antarcticirhabdus aurantiaca TaxID=2606717 RepID=A0ACD4NTV5_9HYPH|nr:ribokinase [Antarcticirhabdus aurantiaca]WAJ30161.1 ribokinase [Jeongeuplla avenae]